MSITVKIKELDSLRIAKALAELENNNNVLKVGWLENSKYPDKKGTNVAYVAAIQEFGSSQKNIPPRPFIRPAVEKNSNKWANEIEKSSKLVLEGKQSIDGMLYGLGNVVRADIQIAITEVKMPELEESTIRNRLRKKKIKAETETLKKPLVDTGLMLATVTQKVEPE